MPKVKTSKSAVKRFKISARGKFLHRKTRQNHFNAKQSGSARRNKRSQSQIANQNFKDIDYLMPYAK